MNEAKTGRLSFRAVEVFVAALEEGSIAGAANRLRASPSTVSQQLSNLEQVLDARLIERSARRFQLTAAGEIFSRRAKAILDEVTGAKIELSSAKHAPKMDIRIAVIEDLDQFVLPNWLKAIKTLYPQCQISVQSGASHESYAALSSRGVDIIVAADNTSGIDWVEEHAVMQDPFMMVTASAELARAELPELMQRPFVRYSQEQLIGRQIEAQLRRTRNVPAQEFECTSNHAVFSLVQNFNGWAITTASAYLGTINSFKPDLDIFAAPLPVPAFARTVSIYSRRDTMGEIPKVFADTLKHSLEHLLVPTVNRSIPFLANRFKVILDSD